MSLILARTLFNKFYKEKFDAQINSDQKLISPRDISFNCQAVCNENMRNDATDNRS